jgi:hypothetical protein
MIDFSLRVGRSKRYPYAARHFHTCHILARRIESWGDLVDHRSYGALLRRDHGRKYGFWSLVPQEVAPEFKPDVNRNVGEKQAPNSAANSAASDGALQPGLW